MVIDSNNKLIDCPSLDEFTRQAEALLETDSAEVWISERGGQDDMPCLSILINRHEYVINYFGADGCNYASIGNENDDRSVSFCNGQYIIAGYQVIPKDAALTILLDFFRTLKPSEAIRWEEL